jgi:hypothetical protein
MTEMCQAWVCDSGAIGDQNGLGCFLLSHDGPWHWDPNVRVWWAFPAGGPKDSFRGAEASRSPGGGPPEPSEEAIAR